jgi:hypothetical protein
MRRPSGRSAAVRAVRNCQNGVSHTASINQHNQIAGAKNAPNGMR